MRKKIIQKAGLVTGTAAIIFTAVAGCFSMTGCGKETKKDVSTETAEKTVAKYDFSKINTEEYIRLPDYKNKDLVSVSPGEVTDADVEKQFETLVTNQPVYQKVTDRKIRDNDSVNIDYTAALEDGTQIGGGTGSRLDIGTDDTLKEVGDSLAGHIAGDSYSISVTFPDDYKGTYSDKDGKEQNLAGEKANFRITVNYIYGDKKDVNEITDDDVREMTGDAYKTLAEYKAYLKKQLVKEQESGALSSVWESLISQTEILDDKKDDFRQMTDYEYDYETSYYLQMAEAYGTDLAGLAVNYGYDDEDAFKDSIKTDSEEIVKHYLIAYDIAKKENLIVDDKDLAKEEEAILSDYGVKTVEELENTYGKTEVKLFVQLDKVDEFLAKELGLSSEK